MFAHMKEANKIELVRLLPAEQHQQFLTKTFQVKMLALEQEKKRPSRAPTPRAEDGKDVEVVGVPPPDKAPAVPPCGETVTALLDLGDEVDEED